MNAKSVVLKTSLDEGIPTPEIFDIVENTNPPTAADLKDGDILVQLLAVSADPYLRGSIRSTGAITAGSVMNGFVVGKVLASNNCTTWVEGDLFGSALAFTTIQILTKAALSKTLIWKLSEHLNESNISIGLGEWIS